MKRRENPLPIARILIVAILLGAMPIVASPVIQQHGLTPSLTLDICNPLPPFRLRAASCSLPTMNALAFECPLDDRGIAIELTPRIIGRAVEAPDPPPPKSLV